jgi:hypothetical protein
LVCNVGKLDVQFQEKHPGKRGDFYMCEMDVTEEPSRKANQMYFLDNLPLDFLKNHKDHLDNGDARICIPNGRANQTSQKIEFSSSALPKYLGRREHANQEHHRQLMNSPTGTHTVLAVVISSTEGETDPIANTTAVAGNLFGVGPMAQTVNVASQYSSCSSGKLQMVAATGNNVVNGVLAVKISTTIAGSNALVLQNALVTATNAALGITDIRKAATHVLFCLPNGTSPSSIQRLRSF